MEQELLTFQSTCVHPQFLVGSCYSIFSFMCMFCRSLFVLLYFFLLTIVLPVLLLYTDSDNPFDVFKLFLRYRVKLSMSLFTVSCQVKYITCNRIMSSEPCRYQVKLNMSLVSVSCQVKHVTCYDIMSN